MRKIGIILIAVMLLGLLSGCASPSNEGKVVSGQGTSDDKILIVGLEEKEIEITVEKLRTYESVTREVTSVNSSGKENKFKATGCLLEDVLKDLGYSQKSLQSIRLVAGDGYSMDVPKEVVNLRDIILAYEIDGEELEDKSKPIRVVIPEERAMYWVRNLSKIEVLESVEQSTSKKIIFLEAVADLVSQEDYIYYDSTDKAIKIEELASNYINQKDSSSTYIKAVDGLEKNETISIFNSGYIKITGKDAPMFLSPDVPKGMYVKNILWFSQGDVGFFSLKGGLELFETKAIDDKTGVSLLDVLKEAKLEEGKAYTLTAGDGYSVEIGAEDIKKGIVYFGKEGEIRTIFEGLPKNTNIKGLLSIEVIE